jgi:hypothetical protein
MATRETDTMSKTKCFTKTLICFSLFLAGGCMAGNGWYDGERWRVLHEDSRQVARLELHGNDLSAQRVSSVSLQPASALRLERKNTDGSVVQAPVFRDHRGGPIRVAIGGVLLQLSDTLSTQEQADWLATEGLSIMDAPEGVGWILVNSPPGQPSIDLANRLYKLPDVVQSSPNWWRPTTRR